MLFLLVLVFLCGVESSNSGYHLQRNLVPSTAQSDDAKMRQFSRNVFSRHRLNSMVNSQHYRTNRDYYGNVRDHRLNHRFLYPNRRYWYSRHSLRNRNQPLRQQRLPLDRREDSLKFSRYDHSLGFPKRASGPPANGGHVVENGAHFPFRTRMQRHYRIYNGRMPYGPANKRQPEREIDRNFLKNNHQGDFRSRGITSPTTYDETEPRNGTSAAKESKRDVSKAKMASQSRFRRLYRSLGRFDMLYLLGLFLIFIPVASAAVVVLPVASFCWSACKGPKQKKQEDAGQSSEDVVLVETAVADESARSVNPAAQSDSYKDMYKNFVSNEIDGDGDTVAKRMKLERWMTQNAEQRPRPRPRLVNRNFNSIEMEKVEEEEDSERTEDESQSESEGSPEHLRDSRKTSSKGNSGANRQESEPFAFAQDRVVTVGRFHHPRYTMNPRHVYSLVDHSRRLPRRTSYSMVDINPVRFSRL